MRATGNPKSKYYKLGLFYYNPDDPNLFVERKIGLGTDLNWAHKKSYLLMIFVILLPVLTIIVPLYFLGYLE